MARRVAPFVLASLAIATSMLWIDEPLAALFGDRFHFTVIETAAGHDARACPPVLTWCCCCLAGAGVVAGNWHYVSDTIAGAVLGLSAGMAAGKLKQSWS